MDNLSGHSKNHTVDRLQAIRTIVHMKGTLIISHTV